MRPIINPGPSIPPDWMRTALNLNDIFWGGASLAMLFFVVILPKLRTGRLSLEGLLCLAFIFAWWQDPIFNYLVAGFTCNSTAFMLMLASDESRFSTSDEFVVDGGFNCK